MYYSRFMKTHQIWNESNIDLDTHPIEFMDDRPYSTDYLKRLYSRLEDKEIEVLGQIEDTKQSLYRDSDHYIDFDYVCNNSAMFRFQNKVRNNIVAQMISIENELTRRIRYVKFIDALNNDNEGA